MLFKSMTDFELTLLTMWVQVTQVSTSSASVQIADWPVCCWDKPTAESTDVEMLPLGPEGKPVCNACDMIPGRHLSAWFPALISHNPIRYLSWVFLSCQETSSNITIAGSNGAVSLFYLSVFLFVKPVQTLIKHGLPDLPLISILQEPSFAFTLVAGRLAN